MGRRGSRRSDPCASRGRTPTSLAVGVRSEATINVLHASSAEGGCLTSGAPPRRKRPAPAGLGHLVGVLCPHLQVEGESEPKTLTAPGRAPSEIETSR